MLVEVKRAVKVDSIATDRQDKAERMNVVGILIVA